MTDVQISSNESQEDLVVFFTGFNDLLEQLDSDADNIDSNHKLISWRFVIIKDLSYDRIHNFLAYSISPLRFDRNTDTDNWHLDGGKMSHSSLRSHL